MTEVPGRELRNDTAGMQRSRRAWIGRDDLVARLGRAQADPGLRADLAEPAGDTTDDLDPLR